MTDKRLLEKQRKKVKEVENHMHTIWDEPKDKQKLHWLNLIKEYEGHIQSSLNDIKRQI